MMDSETGKRLLSKSLDMLRLMQPLTKLKLAGYSGSFKELDELISEIEAHAPFNSSCPMCRMKTDLLAARENADYFRGKIAYRPGFFD